MHYFTPQRMENVQSLNESTFDFSECCCCINVSPLTSNLFWKLHVPIWLFFWFSILLWIEPFWIYNDVFVPTVWSFLLILSLYEVSEEKVTCTHGTRNLRCPGENLSGFSTWLQSAYWRKPTNLVHVNMPHNYVPAPACLWEGPPVRPWLE